MLPDLPRLRGLNLALALIALASIALALLQLNLANSGFSRSPVSVDGIPAMVYRPDAPPKGPVIVIAHGFAGSQQLMQPFAATFARNGYVAVTFDFAGHGRNPAPMTGSITQATGATQTLVKETARMADFSQTLGDGRLVLLGHSMASDIIVRFAQTDARVKATVAVSMYSTVVTAESPRNLLVIAGDWEGMLKQEALRVVGLVSAPAHAAAGITYGEMATGRARRAAFSPATEHVSVLYSQASMGEALGWADATFGISRTDAPRLDGRGPWIMLLLAGVVLLARPLSALLPVVSPTPLGAGLPWRRLWLPVLLPMIVTPLVLRVLPTHFLPVLVGDYLAAHFAMYGALTALCLFAIRRKETPRAASPVSGRALVLASALAVAFGFIGIIWPINAHVTSFIPGAMRLVLMAAMLVGTLLFFLSDEWLTRGRNLQGQAVARGAYFVTKLAFLVSLSLAVALDFRRLFFLIIIIPVIVIFFAVYGMFSSWIYRQTNHPSVAGIANAVAFAWAISVTFPMLAG